MFCQTCGASHQPEDRFCDACGASLPADDDAAVKGPAVASGVPHPPVWVTAAAGVLLITTLGFSAAWCSAGRQRDSAIDAKNTLEGRVRSLEGERNGLVAERNALAGERDALVAERKAYGAPEISRYTVIAQQFFGPDVYLTFGTQAFDRRTRAICYEVSGPNRSFGVRDVDGTLTTKLLQPDGSLFRGASSPEDFTRAMNIAISRTAVEWKSPLDCWKEAEGKTLAAGTWSIQFYWGNRQIGRTIFSIQRSLLGALFSKPADATLKR
jgi:hypothetical protein